MDYGVSSQQWLKLILIFTCPVSTVHTFKQNSSKSIPIQLAKSYLEMEFAVDSLIVLVDQFECVTSIAVHVSVAIGGSSVRKQERHLVARLWSKGDEIPKHVRVLEINKPRVLHQILQNWNDEKYTSGINC